MSDYTHIILPALGIVALTLLGALGVLGGEAIVAAFGGLVAGQVGGIKQGERRERRRHPDSAERM